MQELAIAALKDSYLIFLLLRRGRLVVLKELLQEDVCAHHSPGPAGIRNEICLMLLPVGTAHTAPVLCSALPKLLCFSHPFSPSPLQAQMG